MKPKLLFVGIICFGLFNLHSNAMSEVSKIYHRDLTGNIQHHKPSAEIQASGRIVEVDHYGNKQLHKEQYQIKNGAIYQTDKYGNIQYHKSYGVIQH